MIAIGVTGTDTGVGKTVVSCALAAALAHRGARVGVMKPVETGVAPRAETSDAHLLSRAAESHDEITLVRPYTFAAPLAPLVAARREQQTIDLARLDRAFHAIAKDRDVVIVEGAGGLLVPLTPECTFATLFARWGLQLVVVAPNRLGVVNHALLTLRAAAAAQLITGALVLHDVAPESPDESARDNAALLAELTAPLPVLSFPWMPQLSDHHMLRDAAESSGLVAAVAPAASRGPQAHTTPDQSR